MYASNATNNELVPTSTKTRVFVPVFICLYSYQEARMEKIVFCSFFGEYIVVINILTPNRFDVSIIIYAPTPPSLPPFNSYLLYVSLWRKKKKIDGARVLKVDSTQASFHSLYPLSQYSTYISIVYCYR